MTWSAVDDVSMDGTRATVPSMTSAWIEHFMGYSGLH